MEGRYGRNQRVNRPNVLHFFDRSVVVFVHKEAFRIVRYVIECDSGIDTLVLCLIYLTLHYKYLNK
jgi:hypothetical protein